MHKYPKAEKACREYLKEHPEANGIKKENKSSLFGTLFEPQQADKPQRIDKPQETWYAAVDSQGYPEVTKRGQIFLYTEGEPGRGKVRDIENLAVTAAMKGATRVCINFMRPGAQNIPIEKFIADRGLTNGTGKWDKLEVM